MSCRISGIVGVLAVSLAASACGSSATNNASTGAAAETQVAAAAAGEQAAGSDVFGLTPEDVARRVDEVEAAISSCMTAAGFDYVAVDFDTIDEAMSFSGAVPGMSDEEFLAQFGFGITTRLGEPDPVIAAGLGQNQATIDALGEADRDAYLQTLVGENAEATFAVTLEGEDFSEAGGCTKTAVDQFFTAEELSGNYVHPFDLVLENDPRLQTAYDEWSACMAEAGYDYETLDDVDDDLAAQVEAIVGDRDPLELTGASRDALTELQGLELAVAVVSDGCEVQVIDPVVEQIETEYFGAPQ